MNEGTLFTLPSYREAQAAETFLKYIPWAEQVRFGKTGTDVTTAAVRLARAYTGRVIVRSHGYHGWAAWSIGLTSPALGIPVEVGDRDSGLVWGDSPFAEGQWQPVAAVIVEVAPGGNLDDDWLHELREQCTEHGTILIFDEVLSGFRFRMGSATDVIPDLACYGKSIGNGYAVSALVGKKGIMSLMEPGQVFFSGTSFGDTTGLAAMEATLTIMEREQVPQQITSHGIYLKNRANAAMPPLHGPPNWVGDGARITTSTLGQKVRDFIQQECVKRGLLFLGAHNMCMSHTREDVDKAVEVYAEVWELMQNTEDLVAALDGPPSFVPFRMQ